jgi:hypothetical protein
MKSSPGKQRCDVHPGLAEDVERPEPDSRRHQMHGHQNVPVVSAHLLEFGHDADLLILPGKRLAGYSRKLPKVKMLNSLLKM